VITETKSAGKYYGLTCIIELIVPYKLDIQLQLVLQDMKGVTITVASRKLYDATFNFAALLEL
jgi:hypothetical protein